MTAKNLNNGARMWILRALATDGLQTTNELAGAAALTAKQVRDNCAAARADGLLVNVRDDVTNSLAYQITPLGRRRIEGDKACSGSLSSDSGQTAGAADHDKGLLSIAVEQELSESVAPSGEHQLDSRAHFLRTEMRQALARKYPRGNTCAHVDDFSGVEDAEPYSDVSSGGPSCESETPISVDAIDATEPAPPPEQYAICRAGQGHLSAWPLRDMTIDEARQLAIDDAAAIGGEVVLYRCVPIGKAFPRIVFEEA